MSRGVKGGTVIAEDVLDLAEHVKRMTDPDGYRCSVGPCLCCKHSKVHALCFRERLLRPASADEKIAAVTIRLFRCASESCGAVFTVLPAFIARHLWRAWKTVEEACKGKAAPPPTTLRRWLARQLSDAMQLVQVFTSSAAGSVAEVLKRVRPQTRAAFVQTLVPVLGASTGVFASVTAWIHRLERGIRLM